MVGQARLEALGITPEVNSYAAYVHDDSHAPKPIDLFRAHENGDIDIRYLTLGGRVAQYKKSGQVTAWYEVTRLAEPKGDMKYKRPAKAGARPYLTPLVIEAYKTSSPIDTLVITEGEFKAYKATMHGVHAVGIGGIHLIKDKESKKLYGELAAIIERCAVKNVLFLLDADCLEVRYDEHKDLHTRPKSFYSAVRNLREALKEYDNLNVYFGHLHREAKSDGPKGLDDLYLNGPGSEELVSKELLKLANCERWFRIYNVGDWSLNKLLDYFNIDSINAFYTAYASEILQRPFIFRGGVWRVNIDTGEPEQIRHEASSKFIRVGCDYFMLAHVPNSRGVSERRRLTWNKSEIKQDYGKDADRVLTHMERYNAFCNVPDHTSQYQQVVEGCYNLYFKVEHEPEPGAWPCTERYLRHLFQNEHQDCYELALDYLTLIYTQPTQLLPILCLVSEERGTGKSTLLWYLRKIYGENATVLGNQELMDTYNDDWASKLIIGVDEGLIDKRHALERLKSMATNTKIKLHGKFANRQDIDFFGKFIITSNNETNFLQLDDKEVRFWIVKVPVLQQEDPDLLDKMTDEVPAFLHHLLHRPLHHTKKSRLWFAPELLVTDAQQMVVRDSVSWTEKNMRSLIRDAMLEFGEVQLHYTKQDLLALLNKAGLKGINPFEVDNILRKKWKVEAKLLRYTKPYWQASATGGDNEKVFERAVGRCYSFDAANFLEPHELAEIQAGVIGTPTTDYDKTPF